MASDELQVQTKIIKSARQDGGYGRKCSNRFAIGVPDLLLAIPPFAPFYLEVKDFGKVPDNFDRQIEVTEKQAYELELFSKPFEDAGRGRVGFIGVSILHRKEHRLVILPRQAMRLSSAYEDDPRIWTKRMTGGYYDLKPALERWNCALAVMPVEVPVTPL